MLTGVKLLTIWFCFWFTEHDGAANPEHPLGRMRTSDYLAKRRVVKGIWIATGMMMLAFPLTHFIVTLGLFTTFLSFTILDETA